MNAHATYPGVHGSRSYVYKKVTKPLLERRRRARMSKCLEELKTLMIAHLKLNAENINRLEKADVLELTVQHLHRLRSGNNVNLYQDGFNECAVEACHFLETIPGVNAEVGERLAEHLESCTGPLSIQLPEYKLSFISPDSPSSSSSNISNRSSQKMYKFDNQGTTSPGLLMKVSEKPSTRKQQTAPYSTNKSVHPYWICPSSFTESPCSSNCSKTSISEDMWRPW